jgi:hypothetical protein
LTSDILDGPWTIAAEAALSRVGEEMVILHLGSGTYFGLDPLGTRIWKALQEKGELRLLCREIGREFGQADDVVAEDVRAFLRDLSEHQLIVPA